MTNRIKRVIHDVSRKILPVVDDWVSGKILPVVDDWLVRLIEARINDLTDNEKERLIAELEKIRLKRKQ